MIKENKIIRRVVLFAGVIAITIFAAFLGFTLSFGECYKTTCSELENSAMFVIPLTVFVLAGYSAIRFDKKFSSTNIKLNKKFSIIFKIVVFIIVFQLALWGFSQFWS